MNLASLAEKNLAQFGEYERLVFEEKSFTNRELSEQAARLASAFEGLGLVPGDKVVVMMPNAPEVFISYEGAWRAGLTVIPVLFVLEANELRYILENSEAKAVVTSPDVAPKVAQAVAALGRRVLVVVTGSLAEGGVLSFDALVQTHAPRADVVARADGDVATILYTSGTTGSPKGVMQTHRNLYANAMNGWNSSRKELGLSTLSVLPLAHTFGLSQLLSGYLFGSRSVLMRWFKAEEALRLIAKHKLRGMAGVPTMFVYMLNLPNAHEYDTSSVTRWYVGAAPMPVEQVRAFEAKFGGVMHVGYGLTEASPSVASEREGLPRKYGSTGIPVEGVSVRIVDEEGATVTGGTVGEIAVQGENVSPGYYRNPKATAEVFRDGWLFTGDMGYLDDDGYLFIVERKKDLVIRAGLNVYPRDVEEVLAGHPGVAEAAVVGVPDTTMGEEVCAYVVLREGARVTAAELIAHCQSALAKYKTPRYVEIVDALPKTGIGKIRKKELRKMATERFGR